MMGCPFLYKFSKLPYLSCTAAPSKLLFKTRRHHGNARLLKTVKMIPAICPPKHYTGKCFQSFPIPICIYINFIPCWRYRPPFLFVHPVASCHQLRRLLRHCCSVLCASVATTARPQQGSNRRSSRARWEPDKSTQGRRSWAGSRGSHPKSSY